MASKATQEVHVFVRDVGNGVKEAHVWPPVLFAAKTGGAGGNGDDIRFHQQHERRHPLGVSRRVQPEPEDEQKTRNRKGKEAQPAGRQHGPERQTTYSIFCCQTGSLAIRRDSRPKSSSNQADVRTLHAAQPLNPAFGYVRMHKRHRLDIQPRENKKGRPAQAERP